MPYTRKTWANGPGGGTPITAPELNRIETGVNDAHNELNEVVHNVQDVRASLIVKYSSADMYSVVRVHTGGRFIPRLVRKAYPDGYTGTGNMSTFLPPAKDIKAYHAVDAVGASILFNASGYNTTRIRGLQIQNGILYANFENISGQRGYDALCFHFDGTSKIYSSRFGDTGASCVAAGVADSFGFGPALVIDGVVQTAANNPGISEWDPVSGRQGLGMTQTGDIVLVTTYGVTSSTGISGATFAQRMKNEGAYNAIMLDGGGSAQTLINGQRGMVSSDSGRVRESPDVGYINVVVNDFDTGWRSLVSSLTSNASQGSTARPVRARRVNDTVMLSGRINASPSIGTAWTQVIDMPHWLAPSNAFTQPVGMADANGNASPGLGTVSTNSTNFQVRSTVGTNSPWIDINGYNYPID